MRSRAAIPAAGTGGWHVGDPPDARMRATAREHGVSLDHQRADRFEAGDLAYFDYIFAMDRSNLEDIRRLDADGQHREKVRLFRSFDPYPDDQQVPDPYYGGPQGFELVFQIVDRTTERLLDHLAETYTLRS